MRSILQRIFIQIICGLSLGGVSNLVVIGKGCHFYKTNTIFIEGSNNKVLIGENVTFDQDVSIVVGEGTSVSIGQDCIVAKGVRIRTSDQHAIYNSDDERINPAKGVSIGSHVWLGASVIIMKGTNIGSGSMIGISSMVTKDIPENCIAVGTPAKPIKDNIHWNEKL